MTNETSSDKPDTARTANDKVLLTEYRQLLQRCRVELSATTQLLETSLNGVAKLLHQLDAKEPTDPFDDIESLRWQPSYKHPRSEPLPDMKPFDIEKFRMPCKHTRFVDMEKGLAQCRDCMAFLPYNLLAPDAKRS